MARYMGFLPGNRNLRPGWHGSEWSPLEILQGDKLKLYQPLQFSLTSARLMIYISRATSIPVEWVRITHWSTMVGDHVFLTNKS